MILSDERRKVLLCAFADYFVTLGDPDTGGWIRDLAEKKSARVDPEKQNDDEDVSRGRTPATSERQDLARKNQRANA